MSAAEMEPKLREEFINLFKETPCMPLIVRLAWHDAGTYNKSDNTGGANGTVRFEPEIKHGANAGLKKAVDIMEKIHQKYPSVSYADLYQLGSVVAVEYAGGPKIPFRFGRPDGKQEVCTPDGRLPDAAKRMPHLRDIFYRMGFSDKEIVVLSGAHSLGGAHKDRSGYEGEWTPQPKKFDNGYFVELLKADPDPKLLRMPSDMALMDEPEMKKLVETYAKDQSKFFDDYVEAHKKLSELGVAF
eukprot:Plantae.Rhodophyta-Hildenbrandia_rubra.ctg16585.p1 GENE.Plantae.Rhodophyta-Hildenbrandia_rubra.ctg16585~~Plantae.Rhodophyta-Hildenbrandia_rubra.ctg16585.p1  ORF type:complete len:268 (-),score=57.84 Plantae.Rhodophyta-Hildenbrandia_rubra.ctg16585:2913-3641(-)